MKKLLKSKKFWMSVAGVLGVVLGETVGIPEETTMQISGIVVAYIIGQGLADYGKEAK